MSSDYTISADNLTNLADIIRKKTNTENLLTVTQMANAIENLSQTTDPIEELTLVGDEPRIILGEETDGSSITQTSSGLEIKYTNEDINGTSINFTNDGFIDIVGLRRTIGLDCTGWPAAGESGTIYETLEGMEDEIAYGVEVSANEDTVQFTYPDGQTFAVSLPTD